MSQRAERQAAKAARRAENQAAWAAGRVLPRWSQGPHPSTAGPPRKASSPVDADGLSPQVQMKAQRRRENQAAWAAGRVLPRWETGQRPGTPGPRTGPGPVPGGAQDRARIRDDRRAENQTAWADRNARIGAAREQDRLRHDMAREQDRRTRRIADRSRAAAWHEDRRTDRYLSGSDQELLWAEDLAVQQD